MPTLVTPRSEAPSVQSCPGTALAPLARVQHGSPGPEKCACRGFGLSHPPHPTKGIALLPLGFVSSSFLCLLHLPFIF